MCAWYGTAGPGAVAVCAVLPFRATVLCGPQLWVSLSLLLTLGFAKTRVLTQGLLVSQLELA